MCKENNLLQHYRLVIVGHSLGAGVASILGCPLLRILCTNVAWLF